MHHTDLTIASEGRAQPSPPLEGNATLRGLLGHVREGDALLQLHLPGLVCAEDVIGIEAAAAVVSSRVRAFDRVLCISQDTLLVVLPQAEARSVRAVMNRLQPALDDHVPTGGLQIDLVMVGHQSGAIAYHELERRLPALSQQPTASPRP